MQKKQYHFQWSWLRRTLFLSTAIFLIYFAFCLPKKLFNSPTSTVLISDEGNLLNAQIAKDGQWRFPLSDSIPEKFKLAIIAYEDRNFYQHIGISFKAIARAIRSNFQSKRVVSGASTLTMQVARMSRRKKRTYWQKLIESVWALRIELRYCKEDILKLYASNAPFGGNVVGLEAASWRYYGRSPFDLSWSQIATLSVLPNAPGLVHPGKNREILFEKRNSVLKQLYLQKTIDKTTYELSLEEPLIDAPKELPSLAPHLLAKAIKDGHQGERINTTLNAKKQQRFLELTHQHQFYFDQNFIHNMGILIVDVKTNKVVTYIGNSATKDKNQQYVDVTQAPRSSGSILKPFLFASMIQEGFIHNKMLIPDVPMQFHHFSPKNYDKKYEGAVKAEDALAKSLNVPAVYLLKQYGIDKFLYQLKELQQTHIQKDAGHYGLSLILGGAETSLWDIANTYSGISKTLLFYNQSNAYNDSTWNSIQLYKEETKANKSKNTKTALHFDAGSIYETFQALLSVNRPQMESSWEQFSSSRKIAWKTGTSYGNRDAWAVGCTPDYVVAVWVGNATGEGRPGLIGVSAAGPVLFDIFAQLENKQKWFTPPYDELIKLPICKESGFRNTLECTNIDTIYTHKNALKIPSCSFHQTYLTDEKEQYRYFQQCAGNKPLHTATQFVLPPVQAYYYKSTHPEYRNIPPISPACTDFEQQQTFNIIYPKHNSSVVGTIDISGKRQGIILEASHPNNTATLYWHIDNHYLGETTSVHKMKYTPTKGQHLLTVLDEYGNSKKILFTVLE